MHAQVYKSTPVVQGRRPAKFPAFYPLALLHLLLLLRDTVKLQQVEDSWRGCGRASCAECMTKGSRCIGVELIKIEMNVSGSSWKGRESLSPKLVEYLTLPHSRFLPIAAQCTCRRPSTIIQSNPHLYRTIEPAAVPTTLSATRYLGNFMICNYSSHF